MNNIELDNIGIGARDLDRTLAFYEQLGFTATSRSSRGATIVLGHAKLFVSPRLAPSCRGARRTRWQTHPGSII
jgi:catechol 2,3-dioxygenase-like lactoylglutathione lyase family enzyme